MTAQDQLLLLTMLPVEVSSSEPRDVGQLERTYLLTVKLCGYLIFTAIGLLLDFKMETGDAGGSNPNSILLRYSVLLTFIVLGVCLMSIMVNSVNYWLTVHRYANHSILTKNYNIMSISSMSLVFIVFAGVNIVFLYYGFADG